MPFDFCWHGYGESSQQWATHRMCWIKTTNSPSWLLNLLSDPADYRGGFHLQPVPDALQGHQLLEELEKLRLSGQQSGHLPPSRAFSPLLDVPVDSFTTCTVRSRSLSPSVERISILSESPHSSQRARQPHQSPARPENGASRFDEASLLSLSSRGDVAAGRGRSPVRNGHARTRREASPDSGDGSRSRQDGYTEVSVHVPSQRRGRTPLADVFELHGEKSQSAQQQKSRSPSGGSRRSTTQPEEFEISTLTISKARPSLGKSNNTVLCILECSLTYNIFFWD